MSETTQETAQENPEAWRERLAVEYNELQEKVEKLGLFLDKVEAGTQELDPVTKALMVAQHGAMTAYLGLLFVRQTTRVHQG